MSNTEVKTSAPSDKWLKKRGFFTSKEVRANMARRISMKKGFPKPQVYLKKIFADMKASGSPSLWQD